MRLLVTRPAAEAASLAAVLTGLGHTALIEPLLNIRDAGERPLSLEGIAAILLTSANGAAALAEATERRDLPVYAVGGATEAVALAAGFEAVRRAGGDADSLTSLILAELTPEEGALLHAAGADRAGDLAGALEAAGFAVRVAVLYEAMLAECLSPDTREALQAERLDGVLLFSPRTARHFVRLLADAGLQVAARGLSAYCLSRQIADALAGQDFRRIRIAPEKTQAGMLALLTDD
jgi:uroporphyrinogen-III synthase